MIRHIAMMSVVVGLLHGCGGGDPSVPDYYENGSYNPFRGDATQQPTTGDAVSNSGGSSSHGGSSSGSVEGASEPSYRQGVFEPSSNFKGLCEYPRTGIDPQTNRAYEDVSGSFLDEMHWLRAWSHETYLWYSEIPDQNPGNYTFPESYFDTLKTSRLSDSGLSVDRFHFAISTSQYLADKSLDFIADDVSGLFPLSYGAHIVLTSTQVPYERRIAYVEPESPAALAGWERGDYIIEANGVSVATGATTFEEFISLYDAFYPIVASPTHDFVVQKRNGSRQSVVMTAENVVTTPVFQSQIVNVDNGKVGYLVFNEHKEVAELDLYNVFNDFVQAQVDDLVLDLRYNSGGFMFIASQLAYMISGSHTDGKIFAQDVFNDQHTVYNPFSGELILPYAFLSTGTDKYVSADTRLPSLNLSRVFVLTGEDTCSASELVMNSLRGIDVEVIQIGSKTCGKPYGFFPEDNCGMTYFTIQSQLLNAKGFGDYQGGFSPENFLVLGATTVPGCYIQEDDLEHALGDVDESRLATALSYRSTGSCPVNLVSGSGKSDRVQDQVSLKPTWKRLLLTQ